jgi:hypothetical protein
MHCNGSIHNFNLCSGWLAALRNFVRDTALQADHLGQHNLSTSCKGELL